MTVVLPIPSKSETMSQLVEDQKQKKVENGSSDYHVTPYEVAYRYANSLRAFTTKS